jgi:hypothetical protein
MLDGADWKRVDVPRFSEPTGMLSVVEIGRQFDFPVRRVFWVSHVVSPHAVRGDHAHGALTQLLFCPTGSCTIRLESQSGASEELVLAQDGPALLLNGPVWRSMTDFTADACMMVLCDREYAQDRVIEDYAAWRAQ